MGDEVTARRRIRHIRRTGVYAPRRVLQLHHRDRHPPPESVSVEDVPSKSFEPEYVHQTFEREAIALPTSLRPLRIERGAHVEQRSNPPPLWGVEMVGGLTERPTDQPPTVQLLG